MIKNYKELVVWQKAMDLTAEVYLLAKKLPKTETDEVGKMINSVITMLRANPQATKTH